MLSQDEVDGINQSIVQGHYSFSSMNLQGEKLEAIRKLSLVLLDDAKSVETTPIKSKFLEFADEETRTTVVGFWNKPYFFGLSIHSRCSCALFLPWQGQCGFYTNPAFIHPATSLFRALPFFSIFTALFGIFRKDAN